MRGQSQDYRDAAASIYTKAGIKSDAEAHALQAVARYHASAIIREVLRTDERFAGGDEEKYLELCAYYKINPQSAVEAKRDARRGAQLPALRLPASDVAAMWEGAVTYAHKALEVPGDGIPTDLPDDAREVLREELSAVRDRADALLARLNDE
jgi:hypothetical protein